MVKTKISEALEMAQMHFETGAHFERSDFKSKKSYEEYLEYLEYGPYGFCEEFIDVLDLDSFFIEEYGPKEY